MMEEEAKKIATEFPGIALWSTNIDAQMMWLTKNPEDYGVIVAEQHVRRHRRPTASPGWSAGSASPAPRNIGDEVAVFEPTHGSAPKYEKLDPSIVNPIAMILSAAMMLDHVGETEKAERIRERHRRGGRRGEGPHLRHAAPARRPRRVQARRRHHDADDRRDPRQAVILSPRTGAETGILAGTSGRLILSRPDSAAARLSHPAPARGRGPAPDSCFRPLPPSRREHARN